MTRVIVLLLLFLIPARSESQATIHDSTWIRLFQLSLTELYKYRTLPSYRQNVDQSDILVLDSVVIHDYLPDLPGVKFVPILPADLKSKAKLQGDVHFTQLVSLHVDSDTANVFWRKCIAHFFKRYQTVAYLSYQDSHQGYHLTPTGWVAGMNQSRMYRLALPQD